VGGVLQLCVKIREEFGNVGILFQDGLDLVENDFVDVAGDSRVAAWFLAYILRTDTEIFGSTGIGCGAFKGWDNVWEISFNSRLSFGDLSEVSLGFGPAWMAWALWGRGHFDQEDGEAEE